MKTNFKILFLIAAISLCPYCTAQEVLTGFNHGQRDDSQHRNPDGLFLPFFDDFSQTRLFPDPIRWTDYGALVNDGFPLCPPNRNAATLDVLDSQGRVYEHAISNAFVAEFLTSARIRLDSIFDPEPRALTPADSIYFSFYYQPQGNGMPPESHDSLVLQFGTTTEHEEFLYLDYQTFTIGEIFAEMQVDTLFPGDTVWAFNSCLQGLFTLITDTITPNTQGTISIPCDSVFTTVADTVWYHVWSTPGLTMQAFMEANNGQYFKQVMIPINNMCYFTSQFYFRFYNYASIENSNNPQNRGNEDEWNIDMVYLNAGRTIDDRSYPMLTFSGQCPSFLARYQAMPYRQYRANPNAAVRESLELDIANLDGIEHTANYYYTVQQVAGNQHFQWNVEPVVIQPYADYGYLTCPPTSQSPACPYVGALFNISYNYDSVTYLIKHYVYDSTCTPPLVDSMVYCQRLHNYYAYDDGTPEMGYGVIPAGGAFAMRFELAEFDTICGVQLLFNHTLNDANNKYFDLVLWKDENGHPGEEIYRLGSQRPQWEEQIYSFHYYPFDTIVTLAGSFYVGIVQQSTGLINIGFDSSNDNSQYTFYNTNGSWQPTEMHGTLMIRPVIDGKSLHGVEETELATNSVMIYPNPSSDFLNIRVAESIEVVQICIYDLTGHRVWQDGFTNQIPVYQLNDGLYLISLTTSQGQVITQKLIIRQ